MDLFKPEELSSLNFCGDTNMFVDVDTIENWGNTFETHIMTLAVMGLIVQGLFWCSCCCLGCFTILKSPMEDCFKNIANNAGKIADEGSSYLCTNYKKYN